MQDVLVAGVGDTIRGMNEISAAILINDFLYGSLTFQGLALD